MNFPSKSREFKKIHSFQSSLLSLKLVLFFSILFYSNLVSAAEVTLAWAVNTEPDIAGYMIYYGFATHEYDYVVDVGDQTTFTLSGLEDGHTYYFAVTAYDTENLESDFSNEVTKNFEFDNQPPTECECDLNNDGGCDMQDWLLVGEDWGRTDCNDPGADPCGCDLNGDGHCDMQDWLLFGEDWGRTDCPTSD